MKGKLMAHKYLGYFEDKSNILPAYDPGMNIECLICWKDLKISPIKTISLLRDGDNKSYFFRCHKNCYESLSENDTLELESSIFDPPIGEENVKKNTLMKLMKMNPLKKLLIILDRISL